jgi:Putative metallopeptidase
MDLQVQQVTTATTKFSNVHGTPAQRFYNVLCIAYGVDKKLFVDVVEKKYLPEDRADGCEEEYEQAAFAFRTLIKPHIDKTQAKKVLRSWVREVDAPPHRPSDK